MVHYVGLDVSLKQTSICVVSQTGSVVREGVVDSDPELIAAFVRSKAPGALRIGLETGPTTTWLWTELKRLGLPVICIDARHAKAVLKMQINKSDRNDAAGIARIMQTGWFKEVRVKDIDSHLVKALLVSRALLVKIKRDLENQIRGLHVFVRSGRRTADPRAERVGAEGLGNETRQAQRSPQGQGRCRAQARRHSASDVDRRNRVQLVEEGGRRIGSITRPQDSRTAAGKDVPAGTMALVRSFDA
jgi:transposase